MNLTDKKILIGVTGSIAAYKTILLVRFLVKQGAEVKVVMTPSAKDFVSPLVLATLSKNDVITELSNNNSWSNHVALGRWADLMVIAPLSCNTLAKMANGLCDNLLMAVYLSATCPVMVAPAMDEDMWKHPSTKKNIATIRAFGDKIIAVESGELASGLIGEGRMAEPETILKEISEALSNASERKFSGKRVLITAGPTHENIDPVRFIGNHSTGKMGLAIADQFVKQGAEVILILGPSSQPIPNGISKLIKVTNAEEMYEASIKEFETADITIMSAAVADYTPVTKAQEKIKKNADEIQLSLIRTKDILRSLGNNKRNNQILVGFALETNNEREYALNKLNSKNADLIVMNPASDPGAGFGHDTNKITLFFKSGKEQSFELKSKAEVAKDITEAISTLIHD